MTRKQEIYNLFLSKIELDVDFFAYFKLEQSEMVQLVEKRCANYYTEAVALMHTFIDNIGELFKEVNYIDTTLGINEMVIEKDLSPIELNLIASLMREVHYGREVSKLKAMMMKYSPKDLNVFSPANERKSFMDMFKQIQLDNKELLDRYNALERTGGRKKLKDYTDK